MSPYWKVLSLEALSMFCILGLARLLILADYPEGFTFLILPFAMVIVICFMFSRKMGIVSQDEATKEKIALTDKITLGIAYCLFAGIYVSTLSSNPLTSWVYIGGSLLFLSVARVVVFIIIDRKQ